jgi:hypothetical protein
MSATSDRTGSVEAWDTEWAAEKAAEALRNLGRSYSLVPRKSAGPR